MQIAKNSVVTLSYRDDDSDIKLVHVVGARLVVLQPGTGSIPPRA